MMGDGPQSSSCAPRVAVNERRAGTTLLSYRVTPMPTDGLARGRARTRQIPLKPIAASERAEKV
jgi:hypothetical protein